MALQNLKDVNASSDSPVSTPPQKFGDYFILILKILVGFVVFCWGATSNYLNSWHINTNTSYPVFGEVEVLKAGDKVERPENSMLRKKQLSRFENLGASTPAEYMSKQYVSEVDNPYATCVNPGPIKMSDQAQIKEKVNMKWWLERTQQSSYQAGGYILHYVFNAFNRWVKAVEPNADTKGVHETMLDKFFSFLLWFMFAIVSNGLFSSFLFLVFLMWIPGFLGGLIAFMPHTYFTASPILKLCYKAFLLFWTFVWMCIAGWVTIFPVIYEFGHLLYLLTFKQLMDDKGRFITELMKRMKQLMIIYTMVAVIIAFTSKDLPDATKITVAIVCGMVLIYSGCKLWMGNTSK